MAVVGCAVGVRLALVLVLVLVLALAQLGGAAAPSGRQWQPLHVLLYGKCLFCQYPMSNGKRNNAKPAVYERPRRSAMGCSRQPPRSHAQPA